MYNNFLKYGFQWKIILVVDNIYFSISDIGRKVINKNNIQSVIGVVLNILPLVHGQAQENKKWHYFDYAYYIIIHMSHITANQRKMVNFVILIIRELNTRLINLES